MLCQVLAYMIFCLFESGRMDEQMLKVDGLADVVT